MKLINHFLTITHHKWIVCKNCFRCGLYLQGITHDLSKYSPVEFFVGVKYYQGYRSPNNAEREVKGYSSAWLHHKGRNRHHLEYWIDYPLNSGAGLVGCKMPVRYVYEMFCDRIAASKIYNGPRYTDADPWNYYDRSKEHYIMHPDSQALLEKLLFMLKEEGEARTFAYIKKQPKK